MQRNSINTSCLDSKNNSRKNPVMTAPATHGKTGRTKRKNMKLADWKVTSKKCDRITCKWSTKKITKYQESKINSTI